MHDEWKALYVAASELCHVVGRDGEVTTRHVVVQHLIDALYDLDGGGFDDGIELPDPERMCAGARRGAARLPSSSR